MINEKINERIFQIKTHLKSLSSNQQVMSDLDFYTFLATLIPVPGCQQAASLVNKLVSDHSSNLLITELRDNIYETNRRISTLESDVVKIQSMANTVSTVSDLDDKVNLIIEQAKQQSPSEFVVDTETYSSQTIINQIIEADFTSVSANNFSHNHLENVEINSPRTHLRATNHSSNYLNGAMFKDSTGAVSMSGISQQGNIQVAGNGISLYKDSSLVFGKMDKAEGICPVCSKRFLIDKAILENYTHIECDKCKNVFPINRCYV